MMNLLSLHKLYPSLSSVFRFSFLRITCLLMVFISVVPSGFGQFEGILVSKNASTDETGNSQEYAMTMWIKKDKARVETTGAPGMLAATMIYRNDKKIVWMLSDQDSSYFEINNDTPAQELQSVAKQDKYSVKRTGKKKKILGYSTEQILMTRGDAKTELWGSKQLGRIAKAIETAFGAEYAQNADGWTDEVARMGIFPMKAATTVDGHVVESQEITRIDERSLADSLFQIPSGYVKQDVGKMFDGLEESRGGN